MNRETVISGGPGVYPLTGDVASQAGNPSVTVTGLQNIGISTPTLQGGENLAYDINTHRWVPTLRACIQVDNKTVSNDYTITVDASHVSVNGVPIS